MPGNSSKLTNELIDLIGEDAMLALVEEFGGQRLYLPPKISENHRVSAAIGIDAARTLCARYSPDTIRIPIAREFRARRYRATGLSAGKISTRLVMTENSVYKLLRRIEASGDQR